MYTRIVWLWILATLGCVALPAPAHAYVKAPCVSTSQELQQALNTSTVSGDDYVIKVVRSATPYQIATADPTWPLGALSILGGYNSTCTSRVVNPANTVLDFGKTNVVIDMYKAPSNSLLQFDGVTLQNGAHLYLQAGSYNDVIPDADGYLRIANSRITNFSATENNGYPTAYFEDEDVASIGGTSSHIVLRNLQIDHINQSGTSACAFGIDFQGNTVGDLSYLTVDLANGKGFCFKAFNISPEDGDFQFSVYNSIFWSSDNSAAPLLGRTTVSPIHVKLVNNIYAAYTGDGDVTASGTAKPAPTDPLWVNPAAANYHLAANTATGINPAINSGALSVPLGNPSFDIEGNTRQLGSHPDRGAYESPYSDASTFTVSNASDCVTPGCGSLRQSIIDANNSVAAAAKIQFSIPLPCPVVITVPTPLPDILKQITIDGYTQSGSVANSDPVAFNATLCVVLKPGANAYYALRVPATASNASLSLSGVAIASFNVGVELLGGSNHQIAGNQFGGLIDNNSYQLYGSSVADLYIDTPGGQVVVGGDDPDYAKRNVFLNATSFGGLPASAVQIGPDVNAAGYACQVLGNMIGLQDDGTYIDSNIDYGIYVQGTGCLLRNNRIAGMKKDAIFIDGSLGGGNYNRLLRNTLGLAAYSIDPTTSNLGVGVRISGSHNVVGQGPIAGSGVRSNANLIEFMNAGAVAVVGNGYGNTIRGNVMQNNGADGTAMSIDLRADGPTPNDVSDSDSGANDMQNFPTVHKLVWTTAPKPGDTNLSVAASGILRTYPGYFYQVDAYYADACGGAGRGIAQQWVGSYDFVGLPAQVYAVPFSVQLALPDYVPGSRFISVTATNNINGEGSTSEVSTCFPVDGIFRDGVEGD